MVGHTYCVCTAYIYTIYEISEQLEGVGFLIAPCESWTQVIKLAGKCLYLLSHLSGPSRISESYMSWYLDHIFPSYPVFLHFFLPNSASSTFFVVCFKKKFFWVALAVPLLLLCYLIYNYIFFVWEKTSIVSKPCALWEQSLSHLSLFLPCLTMSALSQ